MGKHRLSIIGAFILYTCFSPQSTGTAKSYEEKVSKPLPVISTTDRMQNLTNSIQIVKLQQRIIRLQNQISNE